MTATEQSGVPATAERRPRRTKSIVGWLILVVLVVLVVFVAIRVSAAPPGEHGALDPEGRDDSGALALAEILRDQGVEVDIHRSRAEARAAVDEGTTLVMANPYTLTDGALETLMEPADRVVFLSTSSHLLSALRIGENVLGTRAAVTAGCDVPEFAEVGTIRADRLFAPAAEVEGCFAMPTAPPCSSTTAAVTASPSSRAPGSSATRTWRRTATPPWRSRCSGRPSGSSGMSRASVTLTSRASRSTRWGASHRPGSLRRSSCCCSPGSPRRSGAVSVSGPWSPRPCR